MSIYTIGDLHLSFNENKPMNIFGDNWENHEEKIKKNWIENVKNDDVVVIPGDFSWSTYLEDTYKDFEYLNSLPGKKILLKGNHDYWWTTLTSMRKFLKENNFSDIDFLYNNSFEFENSVIVGTRGWNTLDEAENKKLIKRELNRLELSIENAIKENLKDTENEENNADNINKKNDDKKMIAFLHYCPITEKNVAQNEPNEFIELLNEYNIKECYYGHLHGKSHNDAVEGNVNGIELKLISADYLDFNLLKI